MAPKPDIVDELYPAQLVYWLRLEKLYTGVNNGWEGREVKCTKIIEVGKATSRVSDAPPAIVEAIVADSIMVKVWTETCIAEEAHPTARSPTAIIP